MTGSLSTTDADAVLTGFALLQAIGLGYILGSIPFGLIIAWVMGLGNLRKIGSGNIGATNVLRTGNKFAAAATLLLDGGKGALAVWLMHEHYVLMYVAGLAAMIGHCFPIWLRFQGGKGVATFLGIILALNAWVGLGTCLAWLLGAFASRISSVGALVAVIAAVPLIYFSEGASDRPLAAILVGLMSLLVIWRHKENISRIRAGTEPKIGQKE